LQKGAIIEASTGFGKGSGGGFIQQKAMYDVSPASRCVLRPGQACKTCMAKGASKAPGDSAGSNFVLLYCHPASVSLYQHKLRIVNLEIFTHFLKNIRDIKCK
jgi:hypothetical protein